MGSLQKFSRLITQVLLAFSLICTALSANGTDTYDPATNILSIPSLTINGTAYSSVMMTVGKVISIGGGTPVGTTDTYSTTSGLLTIPAVQLGATTFTNVVATVGNIISTGNGAIAPNGGDTYDPATGVLTVPLVLVGGNAYTNVQVTLGSIVNMGGGTAGSAYDTFNTATNQLNIPTVRVGSTVYHNVVITVGAIVSVGGGSVLPVTKPLLTLRNPLDSVTVGDTAYSQNVVAGIWPTSLYTYMLDSLSNGVTPGGMTLHIDGTLSGIPTSTGKTDVNGSQLPNTYTFGVCAVDTFSRVTTSPCPQTSIVVNPLGVAGTWVGTWSKTGSGDGGCTYSDSGSLTLTLSTSGTALSGSVSADGLMLRYVPSCEFAYYTSSSGTVSGTVAGSSLNILYSLFISETSKNVSYNWSAKVANNVMTGTLVSSSGATGSFSLTKQ